MTATYTRDVFCTLDVHGTSGPHGDAGDHWGKQGPELLESHTFDGRTQELGYRPTPHPATTS